MAVTNYYTVNGRIRGEATGGVRTNYLPDALGSVTATVDESGSIVNQYRYKPYGSRLSKSGVGADPWFQWTGTIKTESTGLACASHFAGLYLLAANLASVIGNAQAWYSRVGKKLFNRLNPSMGSSCNLMDYNQVPVPYITTGHPLQGLCGGWGVWEITFTLLALQSRDIEKDGLIIQNIKNIYGVEYCDEITEEVPEFWEAWPVCNLASYLNLDCSKPAAVDQWILTERPCSKGIVTATGILLYFPGIDPYCMETWPGWSQGAVKETNGLWSSTSPPAGWTYPHHGSREAKENHNCCKPCEKPPCEDNPTNLEYYIPQTRR